MEMSGHLPGDHEDVTPMPRTTQGSQYFTQEADYGVTSMNSVMDRTGAAEEGDLGGEERAAQDESVARALSPELSWTSQVSSPGQLPKDDRPLMPTLLETVSVSQSESVLSSRPGTPLSAPSNLPVPSNPSSFPEDQQTLVPGPVLVMPSIGIVRRKPYTKTGRVIGKLRIMFCGDSGSGKTTLLRTFAEHSPDIVLVENTAGSEPGRTTTEINEVHASSQPCPAWKVSSAAFPVESESLVERNIYLIDTPGYGLSAEANDAIDPILQYLHRQFERTNDILRDNLDLRDDELLDLIAAPLGGVTHVDAAIYCITHSLTETDKTFIHKLASYTTVIPVITKADLYDPEALSILRQGIVQQLNEMSFASFQRPDLHLALTLPYQVSCIDPEMEASVLMHENYTPNLVPSDLDSLLESLLHNDRPARLRHGAAQKFILWKAQQRLLQSLVRIPESELTLLPRSADFTVSRIREHTQREDRTSRLRIAAWARQMQSSQHRSLNEKSAERLIMGDKKVHLRDASDPLGLLRLRERWSGRAKKVLKWCCDVGFTATGIYLCYQMWHKMVF